MDFARLWRSLVGGETPQIAGLRSQQLQKAGAFSGTGTVQSVPGGTATAPGRLVLVSRVIPNGCALLLNNWSANVIDVGNSNQIYFALLRNGSPIAPNLVRVPGETFGAQSILDVQENVRAGTIEIVAFNISGMNTTLEADALGAAVAVRCQAWFTGTLLSERGGY